MHAAARCVVVVARTQLFIPLRNNRNGIKLLPRGHKLFYYSTNTIQSPSFSSNTCCSANNNNCCNGGNNGTSCMDDNNDNCCNNRSSGSSSGGGGGVGGNCCGGGQQQQQREEGNVNMQFPPKFEVHDVINLFTEARQHWLSNDFGKCIETATKALEVIDTMTVTYQDQMIDLMTKKHRSNLLAMRSYARINARDWKDYEEQIYEDLKYSIHIDPENHFANYTLGTFLLISQSVEPSMAIPYLNKAIELRPNIPDYHLKRAEAYNEKIDSITTQELDICLRDLSFFIEQGDSSQSDMKLAHHLRENFQAKKSAINQSQ